MVQHGTFFTSPLLVSEEAVRNSRLIDWCRCPFVVLGLSLSPKLLLDKTAARDSQCCAVQCVVPIVFADAAAQ